MRDKQDDADSKGYTAQHNYGLENCVCHIYGKRDDHVTNIDANKPHIEYVPCKMFGIKTS